jgi:hypothetical protein
MMKKIRAKGRKSERIDEQENLPHQRLFRVKPR